jgi:hypothetical protein
MKNSIKSSIVAAVIILFTANLAIAQGAPIRFDLKDLAGVNDNVKSLTVDGVTLTASTNDDWGVANGIGSPNPSLSINFGMLNLGAYSHNYTISFTFDRDVYLSSALAWNGGSGNSYADNALEFSHAGSQLATLSTDSSINGDVTHNFNNMVKNYRIAANTVLTFKHINPNELGNLGLKNLQVSLVPEPSTYALIFGVLALAGVYSRPSKSH